MNRLKIWLKAIRAPFFTATVLSGVLGCICARYDTGVVRWDYFFLTVTGILFLNTGTNLINDYFDHTSGLDKVNRNYGEFSGGSRVIQQGLVSPRSMFAVGILAFAAASVIGLYLNWRLEGNVLVIIGMIGVFLGYFYTAEPFRLGYTPFGELITGFCCGPLIVTGTYYVQTNHFSFTPILASIPIGILVALILIINEFPDYEADKQVNKKTLVVTLGKEKSLKLYYLLLGSVYLFMLCGVIWRILPVYTLATFLTLPLVFNITKSKFPIINALTIKLHLLFAVLLIGGYLWKVGDVVKIRL